MTDEPALRVVRGRPTASELAAVVTVLLAGDGPGSRGGPRPPGRGRSRWADPAYAVRGRLSVDRRPLAHGGWTGQPI